MQDEIKELKRKCTTLQHQVQNTTRLLQEQLGLFASYGKGANGAQGVEIRRNHLGSSILDVVQPLHGIGRAVSTEKRHQTQKLQRLFESGASLAEIEAELANADGSVMVAMRPISADNDPMDHFVPYALVVRQLQMLTQAFVDIGFPNVVARLPALSMESVGTHGARRVFPYLVLERAKADPSKTPAEHWADVVREYQQLVANKRAEGNQGKSKKARKGEASDVAPEPGAPPPRPIVAAAPVLGGIPPDEVQAIYEQLKGLKEPFFSAAFDKLMGEAMVKHGISLGAPAPPPPLTTAQMDQIHLDFEVGSDDEPGDADLDKMMDEDFQSMLTAMSKENAAKVVQIAVMEIETVETVTVAAPLPEVPQTEQHAAISVAAEPAIEVATVAVEKEVESALVELASLADKLPHVPTPVPETGLPRRTDGTVTLGPQRRRPLEVVDLGDCDDLDDLLPVSDKRKQKAKPVSDNKKQKALLIKVVNSSTKPVPPRVVASDESPSMRRKALVQKVTVAAKTPAFVAAFTKDVVDEVVEEAEDVSSFTSPVPKTKKRQEVEPQVVVEEEEASPTVVRKKKAGRRRSEAEMLQPGYWDSNPAEPWNFGLKNKGAVAKNTPMSGWCK